MTEITNNEFVNKVKSHISTIEKNSFNTQVLYYWNNFLDDINKREPDKKTFLIEQLSEFIIDTDSLFSGKYALSYLDKFIKYYPLKNLNCVKQFVWIDALNRSGLFQLFVNISNSFITVLPLKKLIETFEWGSSYTKWNNYTEFIKILPNLDKTNMYISLSILITIDNHSNNNVRFNYFELNDKIVKIKCSDEVKEYNIIETLKMDENERVSFLKEIKKLCNDFLVVINTPLPTKSNNLDLNRDFIHFVEFSFELINPETIDY